MLAILGITSAGGTRAQVTASATFDSEYDLRGLTLDDGQPEARISLSYDHPSGAYTGLSGLVDDTARHGVKPLGYLGYLGYAHQTSSGLTWDVGATDAGLIVYLPYRSAMPVWQPSDTHRYRTNYAEIYGGVALGDLSVRLFLSPNYLSEGIRTAYLDLDKNYRCAPWLRLYVHGGALTPLAAFSPDPGAQREHLDMGLGAVWTLPRAELHLGWSGLWPPQDYPVRVHQNQSRFVLTLTAFF